MDNEVTIIRETGTNCAKRIYSLKSINPNRMSDFKTITISGTEYSGLEKMKVFLSETVAFVDGEKPDFSKVELGYFEPGHGTKGKKVWLCTDSDLTEMYSKYSPPSKTILLWCYTKVKSSAKVSKNEPKDKEDSKKSDVDEFFQKLKLKHKSEYSPEQLRAWAHLLQMEKHDSLDTPPDKPFFRGHKRQVPPDSDANTPERKKNPVSAAISPCRKMSMRTELIGQLEKWHKLLESGAVSQLDYDELKAKILCDIKEL